eukprot:SM000069S20691  [mRNA]  locus=s69:213200:215070:+ [translate_table: standard]
MHHAENNRHAADASSTEPFQRDNPAHFLLYWLRFWLAAFDLPFYCFRQRRYALMLQTIATFAAFIGVTTALYQWKPVATLWVLIVPVFITSFALMFGNWSQHIFVDPARPRNNYALTYNLVQSADNQKTFNDGYHIVHHVNSKLHWTELPKRFIETLGKHAEEDALVFNGLGFFDVGILVFAGRLDVLANRYVNLGQKQRSQEEIIALLRERLRPIRSATPKEA